MHDDINAIIQRALDTQDIVLSIPVDRSKGEDSPLFGHDGQLDSMGLVSLIVEIEESIEARFHISLILASDRAMSAHRSPFATVGSLTAYIETLMAETAHV